MKSLLFAPCKSYVFGVCLILSVVMTGCHDITRSANTEANSVPNDSDNNTFASIYENADFNLLTLGKAGIRKLGDKFDSQSQTVPEPGSPISLGVLVVTGILILGRRRPHPQALATKD